MTAGFETVRLDPEPAGLVSKWTPAVLAFQRATHDGARDASKLGAAARSDRAEAALRVSSPLAASTVTVDEPPLTLVRTESFAESALAAGCRREVAVARRPGRRGRRAPGRGAFRGHVVTDRAFDRANRRCHDYGSIADHGRVCLVDHIAAVRP